MGDALVIILGDSGKYVLCSGNEKATLTVGGCKIRGELGKTGGRG